MFSLDENKVYTLSIGSLDTYCIQHVSNMDTQVRIGKDRVRIDKDNIYNSPQIAGELNLSYKQVRTAIEHIVRAGTGAVKQYPKFLVITVLNYDAYQSDGQSNGQAMETDSAVNRNENGHAEGQSNGQENIQSQRGETAHSGQSNGQANGHPKGRQKAGKGQQSKNEKNEKNEKEYIALSGEPEFDVAKQEYAITEGRCNKNVEQSNSNEQRCNKSMLHCNTDIEIDIEKEIDIEIEKEIDKEKAMISLDENKAYTLGIPNDDQWTTNGQPTDNQWTA